MVTSELVSGCEAVASEMINWKFNATAVHTFISHFRK